MNSLAEYKTDVVEEVCVELEEQLQKAADAGIPRWNQIVDPGIGFAKIGEQNLMLLGNLSRLHERFSGR
jgi:dihydropteroate synthase